MLKNELVVVVFSIVGEAANVSEICEGGRSLDLIKTAFGQTHRNHQSLVSLQPDQNGVRKLFGSDSGRREEERPEQAVSVMRREANTVSGSGSDQGRLLAPMMQIFTPSVTVQGQEGIREAEL